MGGAAVLDLLQHGKPVQRLITVTEGMPSIIVEEKLAANPYLTGPTPPIAEGSVLPDSYGFSAARRARALLSRMQAAMTKTLDQLWAKRSSDCPCHDHGAGGHPRLDRREGDRQGRRAADDRRRLLQPPADRHEARCRPDRHLSRDQGQAARPAHPKQSELHADNGYNTYRRPGLPDGPIANPGKASIAAVLHPAPTKALYFVADGTGGHVFAETLARAERECRQMVRDPPPAGADVSNRGIARARMFVGGLLLFAAVIAWATALLMSPHGQRGRRRDATMSGPVVASSSTTARSAPCCFPRSPPGCCSRARRPRNPLRDWAIAIAARRARRDQPLPAGLDPHRCSARPPATADRWT